MNAKMPAKVVEDLIKEQELAKAIKESATRAKRFRKRLLADTKEYARCNGETDLALDILYLEDADLNGLEHASVCFQGLMEKLIGSLSSNLKVLEGTGHSESPFMNSFVARCLRDVAQQFVLAANGLEETAELAKLRKEAEKYAAT